MAPKRRRPTAVFSCRAITARATIRIQAGSIERCSRVCSKGRSGSVRTDLGESCMRTGYALICLVLLGAAARASAACTGQGRHDPMSLRQICDMEKAWGQSLMKGDPAVARRILADDFLGAD